MKFMAKLSLRGLGFSMKKEVALMDGGLNGAMVACMVRERSTATGMIVEEFSQEENRWEKESKSERERETKMI